MITLLDLGMSNRRSVERAIEFVGASVERTVSPEAVERATMIVLPGVGAFGDGMARMRELGLVAPLRAAAARGTPILGICLGMQFLCEGSEEFGVHEGLGLIPGVARRLRPDDPALPVPNIGWCDVRWSTPPRGARDECFYFAHGYAIDDAADADVIGTIDYGGPVVAAVRRGSVCGVQFHPEKSQDAGLDLLEGLVGTPVPEVMA
ncbi:MAG: imidazole glycerol phosphate synthase subunit HisH [Phycisphaerales bacterium]|nr:imidazole glycerol phosphate synthase subunit HisH [Phycisphaerales bacterium]